MARVDQGAVDVEQQVEVTNKRRGHRRLVPAERDVGVQHFRRSCGSKNLAVVQFDVEGLWPGGGHRLRAQRRQRVGDAESLRVASCEDHLALLAHLELDRLGRVGALALETALPGRARLAPHRVLRARGDRDDDEHGHAKQLCALRRDRQVDGGGVRLGLLGDVRRSGAHGEDRRLVDARGQYARGWPHGEPRRQRALVDRPPRLGRRGPAHVQHDGAVGGLGARRLGHLDHDILRHRLRHRDRHALARRQAAFLVRRELGRCRLRRGEVRRLAATARRHHQRVRHRLVVGRARGICGARACRAEGCRRLACPRLLAADEADAGAESSRSARDGGRGELRGGPAAVVGLRDAERSDGEVSALVGVDGGRHASEAGQLEREHRRAEVGLRRHKDGRGARLGGAVAN
mmetsp:Transcript_46552/g.155345  ORF Transcript_46552/g.155345 Transcript_46552/m.155345 type:complete len:405 (-) Transcript_46552:248-1462(-)